MFQSATRWRWLALAGGLALLVAYLYGLGRMGLYGPDEPRYASIGREMARSGDFVTPHLWGHPWFEKPPLLYWMTAAGFDVGLSNDLAPRIPVALLSVAFLIAFFWMLRGEFGDAAATYATAILATSAGWIGLSSVGVTDLPVAAMFGLALLFTLPWLRSGDRRWLNAAALALGAAFLAKSAEVLVLAVPALWFGRERWRDLFRPLPVLLFLLVAAPWHIVCYARNGDAFVRTLFWQHQIGRFFTPSLQHVQHWYFYTWMLPAGFFPWTPAIALLFRRGLYSDKRLAYLLGTGLWGFVFFSASTNKLPTYLLPLLPPLAIVMGVAVEKAQFAARVVIGLSALLCGGFPILVTKLPAWMSRNPQSAAPAMPIVLIVMVSLVVVSAGFIRNRAIQVTMVFLLACTAYIWIKAASLTYVDQAATARPVGRRIHAMGLTVCVKDLPRDWRYGLNYYSEKRLPDCATDHPVRDYVYFQNHRVLIASP